MTTATQARLTIDVRENKARQQAAMVIHEMRDFIPDYCKREASRHLAELFYREDVEITTAQARRMKSLTQSE